MIYSLRGKVIHTDRSSVVIECAGVGYRCTVPLQTVATASEHKEEMRLFTHLAVREDGVDLFGFASPDELDCFKMLIGVTGVGPKVAVALLSELAPDRLSLCIASGDAKSLTAAQGVGPKLAQRIVLELKDKMGAAGFSAAAAQVSSVEVAAQPQQEAIAALTVLGYAQADAAAAVAAQSPDLSTDALIRGALRKLSSR